MNWWSLHALLDAASDTVDALAGTEEVGLASMIPSLVMIVAMIAVFYFLLIRPQRKKDKAVKDMLSKLKVTDRITTIGGIYGTVSAVKDDTVTIVVGPQKVPMVFTRWAVKSIEDQPLENDSEPMV